MTAVPSATVLNGDSSAMRSKPTALPPDFPAIPGRLRRPDQWLLWRSSPRDGKWTKEPICARSGRLASTSDPDTWSTFAEVEQAYIARMGNADGIGVVLGGGIVGIDLDGCRDAEGNLTPAAQAIVGRFGSFTEISPSGTGVHIYILGKKPGPSCRVAGPDFKQIEIYDAGRYFAVTGHLWARVGRQSGGSAIRARRVPPRVVPA